MSAGLLRFITWYPLICSVLITLEWAVIAPLVLLPGRNPSPESQGPVFLVVLVAAFAAAHFAALLGNAVFIFASCANVRRLRGRVSAMEQVAILGALIPWVGLPINRWLNDPRRSPGT